MTSTSRVVRRRARRARRRPAAPAGRRVGRDHAGHIDLQDGLTLAQQFGYASRLPPARRHVRRGNVPSIRSRGASEDDTSFVQRLEDGAWVRHDMLDACAPRTPTSPARCTPAGYGTDRVDWDVDGRAYTVLTIRLDDDGGFRNVLMASRRRLRRPGRCSSCRSATTRRRPTRTTGATSPRSTTAAGCSRGRRSSPSGSSSGPGRASGPSLNQLQVIKPRWVGGDAHAADRR